MRVAHGKAGRPRVYLDTELLIKLVQEGLTVRQIARKINAKRTTVYNAIKAIPEPDQQLYGNCAELVTNQSEMGGKC